MSQAASVRLNGNTLEIRPKTRLKPKDLERLVVRFFEVPETRELRIHDGGFKLRVILGKPFGNPKELLHTMAERLVGQKSPSRSIPRLEDSETQTLVLWGDLITSLSLRDVGVGEVDVEIPPKGRRYDFERKISGLPGVISVSKKSFGQRLRVRFDPHIAPDIWIRALEVGIDSHSFGHLPTAPKVPFLTAHTNLALCTTGQFFFPPAIPWVSGFLVITRIPHLRHAARELRKGTVGAPFFGSVVLTCSVAAMAPFASALAEWLGCLWEREWRRRVAHEAQQLVLEMEPLKFADPLPSSPVSLGLGDVTPFDGRLREGELLVLDGLGDPMTTPILKCRCGDHLDAGYRILGGSGVFEPTSSPPSSRVKRVIDHVSELSFSLPLDPVLHKEARKIADRAVYPNLALAALAYFSGGLHMASAVLHQDWSTSPFICAPTEFFQDVRAGLRAGVLIHSPGSLMKLAEVQVLLIDLADPELRETRPRICDIVAVGKEALRIHGWAEMLSYWVGDARAAAFRDLARISDPVRGEARFLQYDGGTLALEIEGLRVELCDLTPGDPLSSIRLTIENEIPEILHFESSDQLRHQPTFERLRGLGIATVLVGEGDRETAMELGRKLGADSVHPGVKEEALEALVESIEAAGYRIAYLAHHGFSLPQGTHDRLVIAASSETTRSPLAMTRLGPSLATLPDIVLAARTLPARVGLSTLRAVPTNLLCILGAFSGFVNGTTATLLAHAGVMGVSRAQAKKLNRNAKHPLISVE